MSVGGCLPVSGGCNGTGLEVVGRPGSQSGPTIGVYWASPAYFSTVGIRLIDGRGFSPDDVAGRPNVVLIGQAAARVFWPNESPIGKSVRIGQGFRDPAEVVGVTHTHPVRARFGLRVHLARSGYPVREFAQAETGVRATVLDGRAAVLIPWIEGEAPEPDTVTSSMELSEIAAGMVYDAWPERARYRRILFGRSSRRSARRAR